MYQKLGFQVIREQDEDYLMVLKLKELALGHAPLSGDTGNKGTQY